ncbi:hypothetical protein ACI784_25005 [Geodermatophilus sp. SYSU D01186]
MEPPADRWSPAVPVTRVTASHKILGGAERTDRRLHVAEDNFGTARSTCAFADNESVAMGRESAWQGGRRGVR